MILDATVVAVRQKTSKTKSISTQNISFDHISQQMEFEEEHEIEKQKTQPAVKKLF